MIAVDKKRESVKRFDRFREGLLPLAGIYGANASGKSNLLAAMNWLVENVQKSLQEWGDEIPIEPFVLDSNADSFSHFEIELMVKGVRYRYELELSRSEVRYEALFHYPKAVRRKIFVRESNNLSFQSGLGELAGTRELLTEKSLALTLAHRYRSEIVSDFVDQLVQIQFIRVAALNFSRLGSGRRFRHIEQETRDLFAQEFDVSELGSGELPSQVGTELMRDQALSLLRMADFGIADVKVDLISHVDSQSGKARELRRLRFMHNTDTEPVPLGFSEESQGTRIWFSFIGPVLNALSQGKLLVIDEIDSSLHPRLAGALIDLFTDVETNPKGAQLIFTAHDTNLMSHLNRDEVWFTEKQPDGGTVLGGLMEFAGETVRPSVDVSRRYLRGDYGAVPQLNYGDLLRSLEKTG